MKEKLIAALEKSRNYTIQVAEAMPEKSYDFKPAEPVWNYKELMNHLAYCMKWMEENYVLGMKSDWNPPSDKKDKKETVKYISASFDSLQKVIVAMKEVKEETIIAFFSVLEHTAHHRGQATTYLRCCGIMPPEYPF